MRNLRDGLQGIFSLRLSAKNDGNTPRDHFKKMVPRFGGSLVDKDQLIFQIHAYRDGARRFGRCKSRKAQNGQNQKT